MPALGESITDGTVSTLLKQPGEAVGEDEPILQIETDKVTIDVRAPHAGTLGQFLVSACYPSCKQSYFCVSVVSSLLGRESVEDSRAAH